MYVIISWSLGTWILACGTLPTPYNCFGVSVYDANDANYIYFNFSWRAPHAKHNTRDKINHHQRRCRRRRRCPSSSSSSSHCSHGSWTYADKEPTLVPKERVSLRERKCHKEKKRRRKTSLNTCFGDVKYFRGRVTVITSSESPSNKADIHAIQMNFCLTAQTTVTIYHGKSNTDIISIQSVVVRRWSQQTSITFKTIPAVSITHIIIIFIKCFSVSTSSTSSRPHALLRMKNQTPCTFREIGIFLSFFFSFIENGFIYVDICWQLFSIVQNIVCTK